MNLVQDTNQLSSINYLSMIYFLSIIYHSLIYRSIYQSIFNLSIKDQQHLVVFFSLKVNRIYICTFSVMAFLS